jgi:hypothetical protein
MSLASLNTGMFNAIKRHFSKAYNVAFWILFAPGMIMTLYGVHELYTKYFDELSKQDHMQFFLRFFFPISLALYITVLERRQRLQRDDLIKRGRDYLRRKQSAK